MLAQIEKVAGLSRALFRNEMVAFVSCLVLLSRKWRSILAGKGKGRLGIKVCAMSLRNVAYCINLPVVITLRLAGRNRIKMESSIEHTF